MDYNSILIAIIFIVYVSGTFLYIYYIPKTKGAIGEYSIARLLRKLNRKEYKIFNNIYLTSNGKSTQIDHLILSVYGIFVIETKNYSGWIHGSEKSEHWTQTLYKEKKEFRNPIKQNWAHIYFLKDILSDFNQVKYHSIIVFVGKAQLKNIYSNIPVIYKHELLKTIKQKETPCLSIDQVEHIANQLSKFVTTDKKAKKEHKKAVKSNIYERERNIEALICPNCKGELVIRTGEYGQFYGCSNYPKCKFLRKI